jgi:hypothetical protein
MSSKLFAFQMANPVDTIVDQHGTMEYDAQAQTLVWHGGEQAQAVYCTGYLGDGGYKGCNAYGDYCNLYDPFDSTGQLYHCDD